MAAVDPRVADPIRSMVAGQRARAAARQSRVPVRVLGFSAGSPDIEDDPAVMLGRAVADQALADAMTGRRGKSARSAAVRARIFGRST